ncbi:hypothetical protein GLOIN_2v1774533 [Rhizophagus clarus]|uniref:Uncharacterized protein n=1 Tax=Rhizophagus clarus TaxID=94130 RepID=A0A8H3QZE0_9GLOM|nr:hypothetical protein GLOIN_2v1774533 [Rhizophagus clarus]
MTTDSNDHDMMDNYDEDEKIESTISIEDEEMSEDDLEFESGYERVMEKFIESDEYDGDKGDNENESEDDGDETSEEASDEEEIIDQPLNNEQMPHFVQLNEFAPYFSNITESLFFSNSSLAIQAYDELVDIIRYPQFRKDDVVPNSRRFRKYRQRLPLLPIRSQKINISNKKTPSTSKDTREAYYLSIMDTIHHVLNNPSLLGNMYFGPGQEVTKSKEFWHALEEPRTSLPIYKLFIDLYYDDFRIFRNVYHSLGGIYIQIGNMPLTERHRLKNHFVLGFVTFGGSFDEFIKLFVMEIKILEKGKIMSVQGNECVIIASLGITTADLPQGNDMVRVKRHSANKGCQTSQTITEYKAIAAKYGLQLNPPILDQLKRERHLQSPQDIYHLTARKMLRFLKITIEALLPEGKTKFIANSELELFQRRTGVTQSDHAVKLWLKCWIVMAKTMAIVFKDSFTEEEYDELHECLHNE